MTFNEIKAIADTLPIGYYTKRRIETDLDEKAEVSGYNIRDDKIVISYPQIKAILEKIPNADEKAVRTCLYHEVSHALLTPKNMQCNDIYNIFEDERIETLLDNFYLDTDFQRCKFAMNGIKDKSELPPVETLNGIQKFYAAVRFRHTTPMLNRKIDNLIYKNRTLNRIAPRCGVSSCSLYESDIAELYNEICSTKYTEEELRKMYGKGGEGEEDGKDSSDGKGGKSSESCGGNPADGKSEAERGGKPKRGEECGCGEPAHGMGMDANDFENVVSKNFLDKVRCAVDFERNIENLILQFNKKNSGGSAMRAYSGVLNPRLCGKTDYKFFERSCSVRGENTFGSLHLNLFIDNSGSFRQNDHTINAMLRALDNIANRNSIFTYDLITINEDVVLRDKSYVFRSYDGNRLPDCLFDIMRNQQKGGTYNYNIVLFDGDACSDNPNSKYGRDKNWKVFDRNNCTIISDGANTEYIEQYIKSAKTIITDRYTEELLKNIEMAVSRAFK